MADSLTHAGPGERTRPAAELHFLGYAPLDLLWLALGCGLLVLLGWQWNWVLAAWLVPLFLIRFFRSQDRWYKALLAVPLMTAAFAYRTWGSWDLSVTFVLGVSLARTLPFAAALYADRFLARRLEPTLGALVYPAVFVVGDFLWSFGPVGSIFSPAATQFSLAPLLQLVAWTGIWGISFLTGWLAATANAVWERGFDLRRAGRSVAVFGAVVTALLAAGGLRIALSRPDVPRVRVGSIAVAHDGHFWDEIDLGVPASGADRLAPTLRALEEDLFRASERAVAVGAKIVFWSEGNAVMYLPDEPRFLARASAFAREHGVYLAPGMLVLHPGREYGENKVLLIDPRGETLFSYEKTKGVFATESDGILPVADTPYGRLSAAICFDMDFPSFANQLGRQGVDIMLVPSFDVAAIAPFHTEVGLFRAVENGFSLVRHVNEGTSMAVDPFGTVLASQDFFTAPDRTMISDVPTRGVQTAYGRFGDWFVYACALFVPAVAIGERRSRRA